MNPPYRLSPACPQLLCLLTRCFIVEANVLRKWLRWAGHVARMGEERGVYRVLVGKPLGKKPLGRPRCRWVDNISMDLWDVGIWTGLGWPKIETVGVRL